MAPAARTPKSSFRVVVFCLYILSVPASAFSAGQFMRVAPLCQFDLSRTGCLSASGARDFTIGFSPKVDALIGFRQLFRIMGRLNQCRQLAIRIHQCEMPAMVYKQ